jgi:hypothetical protein
MNGHAYSRAELRWLERMRARVPISVLGARFRARFGRNINDHALAQTCTRRGFRAGTDGRFVRGQTPWNHGKSVRVSQRTEFRPGNRPSAMRVVGEYRQIDGRWLLKVRETGVKGHSRRDWEYVTHLTWGAHHGPVPAGHVVMVLDKDEDACLDIDNLACVSRAVLARANQDGYAGLPPDRALRRAALAAAALRQGAWDAARRGGLSLYERRRLLRSQGARTPVPGA